MDDRYDHVNGPLAGIVVADFSRVLAGPLTTMMLGDLGADVVKVEQPKKGDQTRDWGPPFVGDTSAYYLSVNRNKRSIALDLRSPQGHATALALVDRADVLVENFSPGTLERLGLGWDELHVRNPRLVYCSISSFGRGAGASMVGYDLLVQAMGGLMNITGEADGPPSKVGIAVVDVLAGLHATIGVLAALRERERTGVGQRVDVNLLSSLLSSLVNQASSYVNADVVPERLGNRHPSIVPYETIEAADGDLALAVGNDRQFGLLCQQLGREDLIDDPRFVTNTSRVTHRDELVATLRAVFRTRTVEEWTSRLTAAGVPCGPVNDLRAAFSLATALGLDPVREVIGPDGSVVKQVANPLGLPASQVTYRCPPPRLGEHTDEILGWLASPIQQPNNRRPTSRHPSGDENHDRAH